MWLMGMLLWVSGHPLAGGNREPIRHIRTAQLDRVHVSAEKGVDVNAHGRNLHSGLLVASFWGHDQTVRSFSPC